MRGEAWWLSADSLISLISTVRAASEFSSISRPFAIPKAIRLRKQCGNIENNTKLFSQIFNQDFPGFLASGHPVVLPSFFRYIKTEVSS